MHEGYANYQDPRLQPPAEDETPYEYCIHRKWSDRDEYCVREIVYAAGDPQLLAKAEVLVLTPLTCVGCTHFEDERWSR